VNLKSDGSDTTEWAEPKWTLDTLKRDQRMDTKTESFHSDTKDDKTLVTEALDGDREALNRLLRRHREKIFNLAVRMLWNEDDASDCTQEILMKAATHLSSFQGRSAFQTWLYRIAANHVLTLKRKSKAESAISGFDCYQSCLAALSDTEMDTASPENALLVKETEIGCMVGMLLCLTRDQRLVYVLGEIWEVGDVLGAEITDITPENFRQKLSRARRDLYSFLRGNCGLVDPSNPCRCARKTEAFVKLGIVNPKNLQFSPHVKKRVEKNAKRQSRLLSGLTVEGVAAVFREHPSFLSPDLADQFKEIITNEKFKELLNLQ
jgi:RNA polymerase sigma factor (sigma-70 family)